MLPTVILSLIFFSFLACFGIPLNAVTLRVMVKRRRKTSTQIFIIVLAMTDLFVCVSMPLLWFIFTPTNMFLTDISCITITFVSIVSLFQSFFIGATIALDRYFLICRPHSRFMTTRRGIAITVACFLISLVLAFVMSYYTKAKLHDHDVFQCTVPNGYIGLALETIMIAVIVVCGGLIVVLYWRVYRALRQQRRIRVENDLNIPSNHGQNGEFSMTHKDSTRTDIETASLKNTETTRIKTAVTSLSKKVATSLKSENGTEIGRCGALESKRHDDVENVIHESISTLEIDTVHDVGTSRARLPPNLQAATDSPSKSNVGIVLTRHQNAHIGDAARPPIRLTPADRQATNMMLVITAVFVITWIPAIVATMVPATVLVEIASRNNHLYLFVVFLKHTVYISNAVNPLVYGFMNTRFRKECLNELSCRRSCRNH
eukprot:XP_011677017.1 PREDICTED: gastrin/cholecystokinin type B receptor-like [Strongylocentrotus purpuratus]